MNILIDETTRIFAYFHIFTFILQRSSSRKIKENQNHYPHRDTKRKDLVVFLQALESKILRTQMSLGGNIYTTEISKCSLLKELVFQHTHESKKSAYNLQPVNLRNHSE